MATRTDRLLSRTDTPHHFPPRLRATSAPALAGDSIFSHSESSDAIVSESAPNVLYAEKSSDTVLSASASENDVIKSSESLDNIAARLFADIEQKKRTTEKREQFTQHLKKDPAQVLKDLVQFNSDLINTSDDSTRDIALFSSYLARKLDPTSTQLLVIKIFHADRDEFRTIDQFHRLTGTIVQQFITRVQKKHLKPIFKKTIKEIKKNCPKESSLERFRQLTYAAEVAHETLLKLPSLFDAQDFQAETKAFYKAFFGAVEPKFPGFGRFLTIQMVVLRYLCPSLGNSKKKISLLISVALQREYNNMQDRPRDDWFKFTDRLLDQRSPSQSLSESDDKVGR